MITQRQVWTIVCAGCGTTLELDPIEENLPDDINHANLASLVPGWFALQASLGDVGGNNRWPEVVSGDYCSSACVVNKIDQALFHRERDRKRSKG